MIRVSVDLAVIELDRADGLLGWIECRRFARRRRKVVCSLCAPIHIAIVEGETVRPDFDLRRLVVSLSE